MELLAAELLTPEQCDQAFVVGVFSLLDAMTGIPMERALDGLSLPENVVDALLHRRGLFEPFLALTEACEGANDEAFARNAERLLLSGHAVNMAHLQALAWAEELLAT
jgi:EAL and modified HD-GYP domain-containing signal transduction protein